MLIKVKTGRCISRLPSQEKLQRIRYLDALRGFTILLVVYFHIINYSEAEGNSFIINIFQNIRMPLFFCISGFFAYGCFDILLLKKRISNRFFKQLWPTILISSIYIILTSSASITDWFDFLIDDFKRGYWFTYTIVQVFLIYALTSFLLTYFQANRFSQLIVYLSLFFIFLITKYLINTFVPHLICGKVGGFLSLQKFINLNAWFFFGVIIRLYFDKFQSFLEKKIFILLNLGVFILSFILLDYIPNIIISSINSLSGIILMINIFYYMRFFWDSNHPIAKGLILLGAATLPIYLYHYFILHYWHYLPFFTLLQKIIGTVYIEIPIVMMFSILIAMICYWFDKLMLRYAPFIHNFIYPKTIPSLNFSSFNQWIKPKKKVQLEPSED